jgi:hypothetical protein
MVATSDLEPDDRLSISPHSPEEAKIHQSSSSVLAASDLNLRAQGLDPGEKEVAGPEIPIPGIVQLSGELKLDLVDGSMTEYEAESEAIDNLLSGWVIVTI